MTNDTYIDKLHTNYELTNNVAAVIRILKSNGFTMPDFELAIDQILCLLGYKYLSENAEKNNKDLGYELHEQYYYKNLLINKGNVIGTLSEGIKQITQENENPQAADVFYDIFNLVDFRRFPENDTWLLFIELVEKLCSDTTATIGDVFNFVTQHPQKTKNNIYKLKPKELLAKFIASTTKDVENLYDPYATYGSLLVNIGKELNVTNYYGQHNEFHLYVLAKLNLLVNGVNYKNIFLKHNSILTPNAWPKMKFDLSVCTPTFGGIKMPVSPDDERFKPFSPKRESEFAYLLDMIYNLDENGTIGAIVPNSLLFKGGFERKILKHLVDSQFISTIIDLSAGLLDETAIPTTLMLLDKKPKEGIFYLKLSDEIQDDTGTIKPISLRHYEEYVKIVTNKEEIPFKSHMASIEEIQENEYNLSINRYIEKEQLEEIDVELTLNNIKTLKKELEQVDEELNERISGLFK